MAPTREDSYDAKVKIANVDLGTWSSFEGGEADSETSTYKPGGMKKPKVLGSVQTYGDVTTSVAYDPDDLDLHWLMSQAGRGAFVGSKQPLDADGLPRGKALVYIGMVKTVTPAPHNADSSDAGMVEVVATIEDVQ